ncbi:hypothetical protein MHYP_G00232430, partial [Metynnis hypsauchen]
MKTRATSMPPSGWTARSRPTTHYVLKPVTVPPTFPWSPSPSLSSRSRTLMTTSQSSLTVPTRPMCPKCLQW